MLGIICVSVHWYAYISTHCTRVSAAVEEEEHPLTLVSVFPVSVLSGQCTLTASAHAAVFIHHTYTSIAQPPSATDCVPQLDPVVL